MSSDLDHTPAQELAIPARRCADPQVTEPPAPEPAPSAPTSGTHIVRDGETLGTIAAAYGISLYDLQLANNIWSWIIYVGQELTIPGDGIPLSSAPKSASEVESPADGRAPAD